MKYLKITLRFLCVAFAIAVFVTGCRDNYEYIDFEKLQADELKLLDSFYEKSFLDTELIMEKIYSDTTIVETIALNDTIDRRGTTGFFMARTERSIHTDTIRVGQTVGFRYTFYYVAKNNDGEPALYRLFSNRSSNEPDVYTVGNFSSTSAATMNAQKNASAITPALGAKSRSRFSVRTIGTRIKAPYISPVANNRRGSFSYLSRMYI